MSFNKPVKEWYKSRTLWAAVATAIIATLTAMYGDTNPVVALLIDLAAALGLYGRLTANTELV